MKLKQQEKVEGSAVVFFVFFVFFIESREEKGGARDIFVVC